MIEKAAYTTADCAAAAGAFLCIVLLPFTHTVEKKEGKAMKEKKGFDGAAKLAWDMFEKTGSIAYYMLFLELNNGKHH